MSNTSTIDKFASNEEIVEIAESQPQIMISEVMSVQRETNEEESVEEESDQDLIKMPKGKKTNPQNDEEQYVKSKRRKSVKVDTYADAHHSQNPIYIKTKKLPLGAKNELSKKEKNKLKQRRNRTKKYYQKIICPFLIGNEVSLYTLYIFGMFFQVIA